MRRITATALPLLAVAMAARGIEPATPTPREPLRVEGVTQAAIQSAFQILRSEYIRSSTLTYDELNKAALQGLLERLGTGAELVRRMDAEKPAAKSGVLKEEPAANILYLRPLASSPDETTSIATHLKEFQKAHPEGHVILDLRNPAAPADFAVAASLLECFVPDGELMFKLKQVGRDDAEFFISHKAPVWKRPVVILADEDTNNVGETVAAVLRKRGLAVILGSRTRGASVRYELTPLDDAWLLRYARAEMLLPDDSSLFQTGLKPDLELPLAVEVKRRLFAETDPTKPATSITAEKTRARYNEAALVARKHPELDDYIRRSAGQVDANATPAPRDVVLQRALDMIAGRTHMQASKLNWDTPVRRARSAPPAAPKDTPQKTTPPAPANPPADQKKEAP